VLSGLPGLFFSQVAGFFLLKVRLQPAKAGFESFKNKIYQ
jgi:hypothetical protein